MKQENYTEEIELPEGITASYELGVLSIKGPKGKLKKGLLSPKLRIEAGTSIKIIADLLTKREKKLVGTFRAHIKNMIKGVTEGHTYKLKICSGHFPMNVSFKNNILEVKNFIGEKVPRKVAISPEVSLTINGSEIVIEGIDKEECGKAAAAIEQLTRRTGFDKRIFQDGIYIVEKDGKVIS